MTTPTHPLVSPFAPEVCFAVATAERDRDFPLSSEERAALTAGAVEVRRLHYTLGRAAARRALHQLLGGDHPVPRADDGRPLWPTGVVGAITHSGDLGAAAVARTATCDGVGLDLERRDRTLKSDVTRMVCRDTELPWVT